MQEDPGAARWIGPGQEGPPARDGLAKGCGVEVTLVPVVGLSPGVAGVKLEASPQAAAQQMAILRAEAMGYLQKVQRDLRDLGLMRTVAVLQGDVTSQVIAYAGRQGFDLISMATHGRTGISHFFLENVAEKVVRQPPCPVLTVRPKQRDFVGR